MNAVTKCSTLSKLSPHTVLRRQLVKSFHVRPENTGHLAILPTSHIASRQFNSARPQTKVITQPTTEGANQSVSNLKKKSLKWMQLPSASWSRKDVAVGRSLMEEWLCLPPSRKDRAPWSTKILSRWISECQAQSKQGQAEVLATHNELVDMLHRVLFAWKAALVDGIHGEKNVFEESLVLVNTLEKLYKETKDIRLRPVDKSYTMLLQLLALESHKIPNPANQAMDLLQISMKRKLTGDRSHPDLVMCNACLHVLAKCSRLQLDAPERAEDMLNQMGTGVPFGTARRIRLPRPDVVSFSTVLNAWANSRRKDAAQKAHEMLDRMTSQPDLPDPNKACYNTVLAAYARSQQRGSAERAQNLLDSMQQSRNEETRPDQISFLSVLSGWAKDADDLNAAEHAAALLERMQRLYNETGDETVRPTASCYAMVLDAWSKRPDSGPKVETLLGMMGEMPSSSSDDRTDPIMTAYIAAIRAWGNTTTDKDAPERATQWLELLIKRSSQDETKTTSLGMQAYAETLRAWSKSSRPDAPKQALALLHQMKANRMEPTTYVFNNALNALAQKGEAESALALLEGMQKSYANGNTNAQPDAISYTTVINALARSKDFPQAALVAADLLEELIETYTKHGEEILRPTEVTFASVVLAWSNSRDMDCGEQAERILWDMIDHSKRLGPAISFPQPNTSICNCVLLAWSRSSDPTAPARVEELLSWMQDQTRSGANPNVTPDRRTYNYVIKTWAKSRRARSVRRIKAHIDLMVSASRGDQNHPLYPDVYSYNSLMEATKNSKHQDKT